MVPLSKSFRETGTHDKIELVKFSITPKPPFNFELVASLYARFPTQCVDLYSKGAYERALRIGNKIHLVRVKSIGSVEKPELLVEVLPTTKDKKLVEKKVRWITGADDDLTGFYELGLKDKKLAKIMNNLYGLKGPKTPTIFEALIIAITEQQIALPVAISMRKRLVEKFGNSITIKDKRYYAFPSPESLAKARPEDIRELKFSSRKSEYIVNVSQKVASGDIDLETMKNWKTEKVLETLIKIKGLGPWTVEYMMCRGMGRYDALPANDMGLRASVTKFLSKKERVSEQEVRKLLEPFGPHKGYAAFYLIYAYAFQKYPQEKLL